MLYTLITTITHLFGVKPEWNWTAMYPEMNDVRQLIMTSKEYSSWLQEYMRPSYAKPKRKQILQISEIYLS